MWMCRLVHSFRAPERHKLKIIQRDTSDGYANDSNIQNHINWRNSRKNLHICIFRHLHLQKWHCKLMWTCFNIKSKCVFCPVCGGGDPLRGISAAAAQFLITLQQTCWSALLRDREHTRHPSAKPAATYTQQRSGGDTSQNSTGFTLQ